MAEAFSVAIIGGGASGLMAAIAASRVCPGQVVLLEKEARVGRKLLATGNGRCNLLSARPDPSCYYGGGARVARLLLELFPPERLLAIFSSLGLRCRMEDEGRVYPFSGQANAVLDALRAGCARLSVEVRCGAEVRRVACEKPGFLLHTADGEQIRAHRVVIAGGGCAAPTYGANGEAHRLLASLGHPITQVFPALSPLRLAAESIRGLKGVRVDAELALLSQSRALRAERGEALFTDSGVSGIAAMQLARTVDELLSKGHAATLSVRLLTPEEARAEVSLRTRLFSDSPMEAFFTGLLHPRIALCLLREASISPQAIASSCDPSPLFALLFDWRIPVLGVLPFENAQVTAGGARLQAFSPDTLESLLIPGLFACGEVLDVDGDCGGYNLMWAWASGWTAGEAAGRG